MSMRISFDPQIDAEILATIKATANGGSEPKALVFLVRHWHRLAKIMETRPELPQSGSHVAPNSVNSGQDEGAEFSDLDEALDSIDDIFN